MHLPRVRAAFLALGLPWPVAATAQTPPPALPTLQCTATQEGPIKYSFVGKYEGAPLHLTSADARVTLTPKGAADGPSLEYSTGVYGLVSIGATSAHLVGAKGATVTATFVQQGAQIPLGTSTYMEETTYRGTAIAAIDTTKATTVTFYANGKPFSKATFPGLPSSLYQLAKKSGSAFEGLSRADAAARGCTIYNSAPSGGFPCFLTSATVGCVGLADDCWELETLRAFRDTVLQSSSNGRKLVDEYYATAPGIVAGINVRPDASRIWLRAYWTGILPSAIAAAIGCHGVALRLYRSMFRSLSNEAGLALS